MTYAQTTPAVTPDEARRKLLAAMDRATARAIEQSEAGIRPILSKSETSRDGLQTLQRWTCPSRTQDGALYSLTVIADCDGIRSECSCPAGQSSTPKPCWHRGLVRRCVLGEAPYRDARPTYNIVLTDLHGRGTQPDPWDAEAFAAAI